MNKIVYLFGAGASRNALPIVNEIPQKLEKLINLLKQEELQLSDSETFEDINIKNLETKKNYQERLINDLEWLLTESSKHASVDTFAKKLTIKRDYKNLKRLKIALSIFFVFEQTINSPDKRYDSFFASIHNELYDFPENIRILSWNYDYQFELSYLEYSDSSDITSIQTSMNINHKYGNYRKKDQFGIYKLNGTTGLFKDRGWNQYMYTTELNSEINIDYIQRIVRNYTAALSIGNLYSNFSFAWENETSENNIVEMAIEASKDAISLVVIGYSFPFFNREIDRKIIGAMTNLKRVYFQAPDANVLIERFQAIRDDSVNIELIPKFDLEQFVLPNEL
jgi:hypothetical protein